MAASHYHKGPAVVTLAVTLAADISISEILNALWPTLSQRIQERASAAVELTEELLRAGGPIRRDGDQLKAGSRVLNDDRELLPRLARATGLGLSVYLGNRRVASSSVIEAGPAPEVGGYADAQLVDTVLRRREAFTGTLDLGGRSVAVACRPLLADGASEAYGTLGMVEAYHDLDGLRDTLRATLRERLEDSGRKSATEQQADRMSAVMLFIDDIARRLQLLALNGNIIAAQAGDHGRAFRVVCRELSSLATQGKDAVAEVRKLTEDIGLFADDEDVALNFSTSEHT